ncbi:MAG: hypothetical protein K0R70_1244 [Steroidobacteraceae bacterium]|jgi:hypothetical protein|nr:hypothetical protein [Steroidobacteraceae bacterium]
MKDWFSRVVLGRQWATFLVLGVAFFVFGVGTLSLFMLLQANLNLLADHGWQAVRDGGAWQLAELLVTGYLALMAYLVFEVCKASLVRRWLDADPGST